MSTSAAEALALNGLLVAMHEIEHELALLTTGDLSHEETLRRIREHVESPMWAEHIQLARVLIGLAPIAMAAVPASAAGIHE